MMVGRDCNQSIDGRTHSSTQRGLCGFVDIHCHCLPGLDDGPRSMEEAITLCSALAADGIDVVVATPHQLGRFDTHPRARAIRAAVDELNRKLGEAGIRVTVLPGGEVRLDERIVELLADDEILTMADKGRHLLVELPPDVFIDIEPMLLRLRSQGVNVVLAHPERNRELIRHMETLEHWLNCGVDLQVTAGSLAGRFGTTAKRMGWDMVVSGWTTAIATDAHDTDLNGPCMTLAYELIAATMGPRAARQLCRDNPLRICHGADALPTRSFHRQEVG